MTQIKIVKTAIGLMSGTSMDGIDVALIKTDGKNIISSDKFGYYPYLEETKNKIRKLIATPIPFSTEAKEVEEEITEKHIFAVQDFLEKNKITAKEIDVIGFHGHSILHSPERKISWQIGDAEKLAKATKINVVADFRIRDVILGGQGAPLVPIYHHALFKNYKKPLIVLNIGGVSNITYIQDEDENNLIACDICFGNAPLDDLVKAKTGKNYDEDGKLASSGRAEEQLITEFLSHDFFKKNPPKSLDRNQFTPFLKKIYDLKLEDTLATLSLIIAKALEITLKGLPQKPEEIIICGGGRKNLSIVNNIREVTGIKTVNVDDLRIDGQKINGDFVEAEAFAFLAVRNLLDLPISFQKTTGVLPEIHAAQTSAEPHPSSCGGVFYRA